MFKCERRTSVCLCRCVCVTHKAVHCSPYPNALIDANLPVFSLSLFSPNQTASRMVQQQGGHPNMQIQRQIRELMPKLHKSIGQIGRRSDSGLWHQCLQAKVP